MVDEGGEGSVEIEEGKAGGGEVGRVAREVDVVGEGEFVVMFERELRYDAPPDFLGEEPAEFARLSKVVVVEVEAGFEICVGVAMPLTWFTPDADTGLPPDPDAPT